MMGCMLSGKGLRQTDRSETRVLSDDLRGWISTSAHSGLRSVARQQRGHQVTAGARLGNMPRRILRKGAREVCHAGITALGARPALNWSSECVY